MVKYSKSDVLQHFDSYDEFFRHIGNSSKGLAVSGDCVSYAAGFYDCIECDSIYGTFLPDAECADAPTHVVVLIDNRYFDGRGMKTRDQIIELAGNIFCEDWPRRVRKLKEDEEHTIYEYVENQANRIDRNWLDKYPNYNHNIYLSVKYTIKKTLEN